MRVFPTPQGKKSTNMLTLRKAAALALAQPVVASYFPTFFNGRSVSVVVVVSLSLFSYLTHAHSPRPSPSYFCSYTSLRAPQTLIMKR